MKITCNLFQIIPYRAGSDSGLLKEEDINSITRFVVLLYDRLSDTDDVNECRRSLFTKKARSVEQIPPTQDALLQHMKRATFQSRSVYLYMICLYSYLSTSLMLLFLTNFHKLHFLNRIWTSAIKKTIPPINACEWGWSRSNDGYKPLWTTLQEASKSCYELVKCSCKKKCTKKCKCKQSGLSCTELCHCGGGCSD